MIFAHKIIISAVNIIHVVSDRMLYVKVRGRWCDIIILNVHTIPKEDKTDDRKDSFCEELECVFNKFPEHRMKNYVGDYSAKVV
jgi:hypothetical protein